MKSKYWDHEGPVEAELLFEFLVHFFGGVNPDRQEKSSGVAGHVDG